MRRLSAVLLVAAALAAGPALAQGLASATSGRDFAIGYVFTVESKTSAPELKGGSATPESQALLGQLKGDKQMVSRFYVSRDISRQEMVSGGTLPPGTLVLHKAGDRYYAIADPKTKTYIVMDVDGILGALEGGVGIVNNQYTVKVEHTPEKKQIAGVSCRKSLVHVTYVSAVPYENEKVLVQQKNDIEVWHTAEVPVGAELDQMFFNYQRDKTGAVQRQLAAELGFVMEMHLKISQAGAKKGPAVTGSLDMQVTELKKDNQLAPDLFKVPPPGYVRTEKAPFLTGSSGS